MAALSAPSANNFTLRSFNMIVSDGQLPSADRLPLRLRLFQIGMRYKQVPDDGLKGLRVRSGVDRIDRRHKDTSIGYLSGVTAISSYDTDDLRARFPSEPKRVHQIRTD